MIWFNEKKHKLKPFTSSYVKAGKDRAFQLENGKRYYTYESWQAAIKDGWKKGVKNVNK